MAASLVQEPSGRLGEDDLPSVRGGRDPRRAVDVDARRSPRPSRSARRCGCPCGRGSGRRSSACARLGGGSDGVGRSRKRDEEGVALRVDLDTAVPGERVPQRPGGARRAGRRSPAPCSCRSRVEPSTSVKRKVTVPAGSSARSPRDHVTEVVRVQRSSCPGTLLEPAETQRRPACERAFSVGRYEPTTESVIAHGLEVVRGREVRDIRSELYGPARPQCGNGAPPRCALRTISSTACEKLLNERVASPPGLTKKLVIW